MNTPFLPQPRTPSIFGPVRTQSPKSTSLSVGQLLDVELGLFLLSQLQPTASPDALPELMGQTASESTDGPVWTPRQHKYLNRGRALLAHCLKPGVWSALIERYALGATVVSAYDVSRDRSWFGEKTVGFSRNRLTVLRKMLA
jgi:pPIWI RE three-gene island domain Z